MDGNGGSMSNIPVILIYASLMLVGIVLLIPVVLRNNKGKLDYVYIGMSSLVILLHVTKIAIFSIPHSSIIQYLNGAQYAAVAGIPVAFFFLVSLYYNRLDRVPNLVKAAFCVGVAVIAVCALVPALHGFFWTECSVRTMSPLVQFDETRSIGFYIMEIFVEIPIIGVLILVLDQRKKLPKQYRSSIAILLSCSILYVFAICIYASGLLSDTGLDAVLIGASVVNFFLYIAIVGKERGDFLNVWLSDVFGFVEEGILIVNEHDVVVDTNKAARNLFKLIEAEPNGMKVSQLWETINASEMAFIRTTSSEKNEETKRDLYIIAGEYPLVYEINENSIVIKENDSGKYLVFSDVTRNRLYIERLRNLAGVDQLTGLFNRFNYENTLREWDREENLPLALVIGDVNDLKKCNDEWGHQAGDELLMRAATILKAQCPKEGMVARIGGDEFVLLLRNHDEAKTAQLIKRIQKNVAEERASLPQGMSVALGAAIKHVPEENMNMLYAEADALMYQNKRQRGGIA